MKNNLANTGCASACFSFLLFVCVCVCVCVWVRHWQSCSLFCTKLWYNNTACGHAWVCAQLWCLPHTHIHTVKHPLTASPSMTVKSCDYIISSAAQVKQFVAPSFQSQIWTCGGPHHHKRSSLWWLNPVPWALQMLWGWSVWPEDALMGLLLALQQLRDSCSGFKG